MVYVPVQCPHCHSTEVIKAGKQANGAQRYRCQNEQCTRRIFLLQYQDRGRVLEIRRQVVDMAINGSGIRDTARVLRISPTTVIAVLKKSRRAATRQSRVAVPSSFTRRPSAAAARRRDRCNMEFRRCQSESTVAVACARSSHRESIGLCGGYSQGCGVPETQDFARPLWDHPVLHGQGGGLSAASPARAAHSREVDDAEDRAQASHVADTLETPRPQDAVFFPLTLHARPPHWGIYEPGGIWRRDLKENNYPIGTPP
jgi:transposase-like protein